MSTKDKSQYMNSLGGRQVLHYSTNSRKKKLYSMNLLETILRIHGKWNCQPIKIQRRGTTGSGAEKQIEESLLCSSNHYMLNTTVGKCLKMINTNVVCSERLKSSHSMNTNLPSTLLDSSTKCATVHGNTLSNLEVQFR